MGESGPAPSVTEVAQSVGLNKSTVHRFLRTLERADFVIQEPDSKRYRLGLGLSELGQMAVDAIEVGEVAKPYLAALHQRSGEAIHLGVLEDGEVVYVGKIDSTDRTIRLNSRIGRRSPAHCTGLGKAMLAYLDDGRLTGILAERGLRRYSPTTTTSPLELREQLAEVRRTGVALDNGEFNELVRCAAAPIFDRAGTVIAAVSVTTVALDLHGPRIRELADMVRATARRISERMGHRPGDVPEGRDR